MKKRPRAQRLVPGVSFSAEGGRWLIVDVIDVETVVARQADGRLRRVFKVGDIQNDSHQTESAPQLVELTDDERELASERYRIIRSLLELERPRKREDVERLAREADRSVTTIYSWLSAYESAGTLSSLVRKRRSDKGKGRLPDVAERIIEEKIQTKYLREERPDVADLMDAIRRACAKAGVKAPHANTVSARIARIAPQIRIKKRLGHKKARERFSPIRGAFPGADYPLAVVQVDHSPIDLILVDDVDREPIGRAYLTIAIDVFSRMLVGFYLSLDSPGSMSAGLCLSHAILRKDDWLAEQGVNTPWPCWGLPRVVHVDNAKEFRGTMISKACQEYGITLQNRPKGQPQYGGHVERVFRTFLKAIHRIPGTTFSNVKERMDYNSEGKAIISRSEFERWFTTFVVKVYHQRFHRGIKATPVQRWHDGLLGDENNPGIGLPSPIQDEERLRLDFLPVVERTVQRDGVVVDHIAYYHDALRKWVRAPDERDPSKSRKFIFRQDYRDLSQIYFLDPDTGNYVAIPYRYPAHPRISIWEKRRADRILRKRGISTVNERLIFEALEEMDQIVDDAATKTRQVKQARRMRQRKADHEKATQRRTARQAAVTPSPPALTARTQPPQPLPPPVDDEEILPFDDIE